MPAERSILLGGQGGWDQLEPGIAVGRNRNVQNAAPRDLRAGMGSSMEVSECASLWGQRVGGIRGEDRQCLRSRAHLLVTHVPVGPFPVTHHFPHHDPKAPDVTRCRVFSVGNDLWGCPAKHTTRALRGAVKGNDRDRRSRGRIYWASALGSDVSQGLHIKQLSAALAPLQGGRYYPRRRTDAEPEAQRDVPLCSHSWGAGSWPRCVPSCSH